MAAGLQPGQVLLLMGEDLTQYRIWDGMRAIDYLQTRDEVDPQRIGCAGHSGGGTLTLFISALSPTWAYQGPTREMAESIFSFRRASR